MPTRRLARTMQKANPQLAPGELTRGEMERELEAIAAEFCDRWFGPARK